MLAVGNMVERAWEAVWILNSQGIHPTLVNMRFVKPFDADLVRELAVRHRFIVTLEDNVYSGGFSEKIEAFLLEERIFHRCLPVCLPDQFIEHGSPDADSVAAKIKELCKGGKGEREERTT